MMVLVAWHGYGCCVWLLGWGVSGLGWGGWWCWLAVGFCVGWALAGWCVERSRVWVDRGGWMGCFGLGSEMVLGYRVTKKVLKS